MALLTKILASFCFLTTLMIFPVKLSFARSLFVSTSGNDTVSLDANSFDEPWHTPSHAWLNARAGDTVYFRGGTYLVTSPINTISGRNGTANQPIVFKSFQDEPVVFSGAPGVSPLLNLNRSYHHVEGIKFVGQGGIIVWVGEQSTATNFHAKNCEFFLKSTENISNMSAVRLQSKRASYAYITDCKFSSISTSSYKGVQVFRANGFVIKNCEFESLNSGIHIKHSNSLEDTGILIANNFFHDCARGLDSVGNYMLVENNLFVGCGMEFGGDGGMGDGYVGCDYNIISHNTFYDGHFHMIYETREEDPNKGCLWNTIKNNIFSKTCKWHQYLHIPRPHIDSDYNLYPPGDIVIENRIAYTLRTWRAHNRSDVHSIFGLPLYRGGTAKRSPLHYALKPSSPGYRAGSDGKDLGADMNIVGISRDHAPRPVGVAN